MQHLHYCGISDLFSLLINVEIYMAKSKKAVAPAAVTKARKLLGECGLRFIRATTGRLFISVQPPGSSRELYAYDPAGSQELVKNLLWEKEIYEPLPYLKEVLSQCAFQANKSDPEEVSIRVAERGSTLWLDLCDRKRRVVKITSEGWQVVTDSDVNFYRPRGALPLPEPVAGGDPSTIRQLLRVGDDSVWLLVLGWLLAATKEKGEHFLIALQGPPGGGKSTLGRNLIRLLDPRDPPLDQLQWSADDVMLAAADRWLFGVDDVDGLTRDKVRVLATICTGIGREVRALWTQDGVSSMSLCRPVIATSNSALLSEARLRDRAVPIHLPTLRAEEGMPKTAMDEAFAAKWPQALGALLSLVSAALRHTGEVIKARDGIRMAEAGLWAEKGTQAAGFDKGEFVKAVKVAQQAAAAATAADWPVLPALLAIARDGFTGQPQDLFTKLNAHKLANCHHRGWPKAVNKMSEELNSRSKELREAGIAIDRATKTGKTWLTLKHVAAVTEAKSDAAPESIPETAHNDDETARINAAVAVPGLLVVTHYADGSQQLHGSYAEQAAKLLGRPLERRGDITVTSVEMESIEGRLEYSGIYTV